MSCPYCKLPLLGTTAIALLGATLGETIVAVLPNNPKQAKKKVSLYLKLCHSFLCDSELALLSVNTMKKGQDAQTYQAITDVIDSHLQHIVNIKLILDIIKDSPPLKLVSTHLEKCLSRMQSLLSVWQFNFADASFSGEMVQ
ncbi:MAG: hypothetical protein ACRCTY_06990 [Candidatus Adiutrix sp.]